MLERIVPPHVAVEEAFADDAGAALFPGERAVVARAVPKRQQEFATARACSRAALSRLGVPPAPILQGPKGEPLWPDGVAGSITHCDGYRAAGVARTANVVTMGVDAEPDEPLPDGVLGVIAHGAEPAALAALAASEPGVNWDRLLFCAKESVYKAWYPLARCWLDFEEAAIDIDPRRHTFDARLLVPGPLVDGVPLRTLHGRWLAGHGLLVTAIVVPA